MLLHGFGSMRSLRRARFLAWRIRLNVPGWRALHLNRPRLRSVHQTIALR